MGQEEDSVPRRSCDNTRVEPGTVRGVVVGRPKYDQMAMTHSVSFRARTSTSSRVTQLLIVSEGEPLASREMS